MGRSDMTPRPVIGYVLQDVRTLEYRAIDPVMTRDIMQAHRFANADAAHKAKQPYQMVREIQAVKPLRRVQTWADVIGYAGIGVGLILIITGIWQLL